MESLLTGKVLWICGFEVLQRSLVDNLRAGISGALPFHTHEGKIFLTKSGLFITGDENLDISLTNLEELYLGFDEVFPRHLVKILGLFRQPLRIKFIDCYSHKTIYLIIDTICRVPTIKLA